MGYCMSYRRALNRNGLFGGYQMAGWAVTGPSGYGNTDIAVAGIESYAPKTQAAGDLRRVETDQRDAAHLEAYARHAGITPEQAKLVLDALFDGVPDSPLDCIHMASAPAVTA